MRTPQDVILEVQNLSVRFPITGGVLLRRVGEVRAVDNVSFTIGRGETLGLVGESGCGKTTVGRAIVNILSAMAYGVEVSGQILYHHEGGTVDLAAMTRKGMRPYRSDIQMVFQDPYASLNPRKTVNQIVGEPLAIHSKASKSEQAERVAWLLQKVGLSAEQGNRYPHEFSGGQRQRIGIARALSTNPKLVIADEPVSALDISVQAQVLNLMQQLQQRFDVTYLLISHDLAVVAHLCAEVAVMFQGRIVEQGDPLTLFRDAAHPYTRALVAAVPRLEPRTTPVPASPSVAMHKSQLPDGCPYAHRCPGAQPLCDVSRPELLPLATGHRVACHFPQNGQATP